MTRKIDKIIIHCADTFAHMDIGAAATDAASAITQPIALIARMEAHGLIAT